MRSNRWLIFAPLAVFALFPPAAKADVLGNWTYSQSENCGGSIEVVDNIITLHGPDYNGCSGGAHWVQIETVVPADVNTVDFDWSYQTNDGWVYDPPQYGVNGVYTLITQVNISSGTMSIPVVEGDIFTFRQYSIDTCCQPGHLSIANLSLWDTTTTSTTTTTTTSTIAPSTTVPVTSVSTTTTPQTTSTYPPEPTMPEPPVTVPLPQIVEPAPPETVLLPPEIELPVLLDPFPQPSPDVVPDPILEVVDTIPLPPDTIVLPPEIESFPPDTLELPPELYDTSPPPQTLPFVGELPGPPDTIELPPDTMPEPPDTLPIELIAELPPELVQALEDASEDVSLTEEQFDTVVESIAELDEEEAVALIEQILATAVTPEQATELASNPEVLAVVTSQQAEEIFETLDVTELDNTQLDALVEAVQEAPVTVRKAFEKTINVFDDGLGDYVPIGSNVPVDTRRTLIAVAAGAATVAAGQRRGK